MSECVDVCIDGVFVGRSVPGLPPVVLSVMEHDRAQPGEPRRIDYLLHDLTSRTAFYRSRVVSTPGIVVRLSFACLS